MAYVYAISYKKHSSLIKIGKASCWKKRLEALKVPSLMKIEFVIETVSNAHAVEKFIHRKLYKFRIPQTEYFYLDQIDQITALKDLFCRHGQFVDTSEPISIEKPRVKQSWAPSQGPMSTLYVSGSNT